jgi:hypothetical protein
MANIRMNNANAWILFYVLLGLAFVLNAIGGLMDMTNREKIGFFTKRHAWHDSMFVLGLAIVVLVFLRC